jgi:hypothetical protein
MRLFMICGLHLIYLESYCITKEDEMGGTYSMYGRERECVQDFDEEICRKGATRKTCG